MKLGSFAAVAGLVGLLTWPAAAQDKLSAVKIGVLSDMSGPLADAYGPGSLHAAELAAADMQSAMPGVKIEVIGANHQNKVEVGSTIARQWYEVDKVDGIFDLVNTAIAIAVQGIAKERHKINVQMTGASSLTGQYCSPWAVHWSTDTHIQTSGVAGGVVAAGGDTWFLITADYSGTREMASQMRTIVTEKGGKVLGEAFFPIGSTDFASAVVQAQASGAKVIALSSGGLDTVNAIKQLAEFGLVKAGKKIVAPAIFVTDIHALGLQVAQGVTFVELDVLGSERRNACVFKTLCGKDEAAADPATDQHVHRGYALSECGEGRRHDGCGCCDGENAFDADQLLQYQRRSHPGERQRDQAALRIRGQEPGREQGRVGFAQGRSRAHARGGRTDTGGAERLQVLGCCKPRAVRPGHLSTSVRRTPLVREGVSTWPMTR